MKTAFIFSGQGAQIVGMGKELYNNYNFCKDVFDEASEALGFSLPDICFNENDKLNKTEYAQPALLTLSMACLKLMQKANIAADVHAGFSLGEYSALAASDVFKFSDAVSLVKKRGELMANAVPNDFGAMSAVLSLSNELVEKACLEATNEDKTGEHFVVCSNYNCSGQVVISGSAKAVSRAEEICAGYGAKRTIRINTSGPFHTMYLKPAAEKLESELMKIQLGNIKTPVITNVTADIIPCKADVIPTLVKQIVSPVLWEQSVLKMVDMGVDTFIELGAGKTLCAFVKKINKSVNVYNVEDTSSYENMLKGVLK